MHVEMQDLSHTMSLPPNQSQRCEGGGACRSSWNYGSIYKRWVDLGFTLLCLPIILPVCFLVAVMTRLDSPGPVFVKLKRMGKDRKVFYKYKFRTMVPNAEMVLQQLLQSDEGIRKEYLATYKIKNDPRVTRFGRFLRKTSLDELPQFLNVIRGEMSWVGPRDILDSELAMYGNLAGKLVTVKPGITGLWQVSGRSQLTYSQRVQLDMLYIDRLSLLFDLKILLKTIPVVLLADGAL